MQGVRAGAGGPYLVQGWGRDGDVVCGPGYNPACRGWWHPIWCTQDLIWPHRLILHHASGKSLGTTGLSIMNGIGPRSVSRKRDFWSLSYAISPSAERLIIKCIMEIELLFGKIASSTSVRSMLQEQREILTLLLPTACVWWVRETVLCNFGAR